MRKAGFVLIILVIVFILVRGLMWFVYTRQHVQLKNASSAQQQVCEANFDKMWKVIQQYGQVTDHYKESFKEVYPALMEGRYGDARGGALFSWIQEDNPNFDASVWTQFQSAIEANRTDFFRQQKFLLDIKREDDNLRLQPPSKWFIEETDSITVVIITSAQTEEVYKSGQENDIDIFKKGD